MPILNRSERKKKSWSKKSAPNPLGITGLSGGIASDIQVLDINERFFWAPYLPAQQIAFIAGIQGCNKSTTLQLMLAKASVGLDIFDKPLPEGVVSSLYYSLEDTPDIVKQRIEFFGGDISKIVVIDGYFKGKERIPVHFGMSAQIEHDIQYTLKKTGKSPAIVAVDTFSRYMEPLDSSIKGHVTQVMQFFLSQVCQKHNAVAVFIHHSQGTVKDKNDCFAGSVAIKQWARSTMYVTRYDEEGSNARYLCPIKTSWVEEPASVLFRVNRVLSTVKGKADDISWSLAKPSMARTVKQIIANQNKVVAHIEQIQTLTEDSAVAIALESELNNAHTNTSEIQVLVRFVDKKKKNITAALAVHPVTAAESLALAKPEFIANLQATIKSVVPEAVKAVNKGDFDNMKPPK